MRIIVQKLYLQAIPFLLAIHSNAQQQWPSPEVEQMYRHAQEYTVSGNLKDAVTTYKQAIILAPDKTILYKELGNVQYLSGDFHDAEQTLSALQSSKEMDAQSYRLLAASQAGQQKIKDAKKTLKEGMARFPGSGLLYAESGREYKLENKQEDALNAWLDGIEQAPDYPQNYYEAALIYLHTEKVFWGLIYGEFFLCIKPASRADNKQDTLRDGTLKTLLYAGWKKMFDNIGSSQQPEYGHAKTNHEVKTFEDAVMKIYTMLTPVVSDGITTENLTMVRTRFLMEWFSQYANKYPFSLFAYQDELVRNGRFDIYNEWLFGRSENDVQFDAWNKFHEGDISRFLLWQNGHHIQPRAQQFYNSRSMSGLFGKKK
jgi:tetratricopeptide repeat protein